MTPHAKQILKTTGPCQKLGDLRGHTIRAASRVPPYTAKPNANSQRASAFSSPRPSRELQVADHYLGTVEQANSNGDFRIRMDSGREVREHRILIPIRNHAP
jgi:hypothetical protein